MIMLTSILTGCSSTIKQQKESELEVVSASLDQSNLILADIKSKQIPPYYDTHIYFSNNAFNQALAGFDGFGFALPNDESINIFIESIRISTYGASPVVTLKTKATKGEFTFNVNLTAILIPTSESKLGELRLKVLNFTPVAEWYFFESGKADFVKALLAVELNKITDRLPVIQLPVSQAIELGGLERKETVILPTGRDSKLHMEITFPPTKRNRRVEIVRYVFLESGVHVFGVLKNV